jgi:hypothetical protein
MDGRGRAFFSYQLRISARRLGALTARLACAARLMILPKLLGPQGPARQVLMPEKMTWRAARSETFGKSRWRLCRLRLKRALLPLLPPWLVAGVRSIRPADASALFPSVDVTGVAARSTGQHGPDFRRSQAGKAGGCPTCAGTVYVACNCSPARERSAGRKCNEGKGCKAKEAGFQIAHSHGHCP